MGLVRRGFYPPNKIEGPLWKKYSLQMNIFLVPNFNFKKKEWNLNNYIATGIFFKEISTNWQPEKNTQMKRRNVSLLLLFFKWQSWFPLYTGHKKKVWKSYWTHFGLLLFFTILYGNISGINRLMCMQYL